MEVRVSSLPLPLLPHSVASQTELFPSCFALQQVLWGKGSQQKQLLTIHFGKVTLLLIWFECEITLKLC